jgi:hypothetical protein
MTYINKEVPGEPLGSTSIIRGLSLVFDWYSRYLDVVRLRGASSPVTYPFLNFFASPILSWFLAIL